MNQKNFDPKESRNRGKSNKEQMWQIKNITKQ